MRKVLQTLAISGLLFAPVTATAAQISLGIQIGTPPAPRQFRVPPSPGADYVWVDGYQYPQGKSYKWHDGYWTRPPYEGAYWVSPYYMSGHYYAGQWEGSRSPIAHDHRWDKDKQRDDRSDSGSGNRRR
jgi:hypothetical protein